MFQSTMFKDTTPKTTRSNDSTNLHSEQRRILFSVILLARVTTLLLLPPIVRRILARIPLLRVAWRRRASRLALLGVREALRGPLLLRNVTLWRSRKLIVRSRSLRVCTARRVRSVARGIRNVLLLLLALLVVLLVVLRRLVVLLLLRRRGGGSMGGGRAHTTAAWVPSR